MKLRMRKAFSGWRVVSIALGAGAAALVAASCRPRIQNGSEVLATTIDQQQATVRLFRKIIGRDPGQAELAALKDKPYADQVTAILNSGQFDTEGFHHLHEERLLLQREGTQDWVKNSYRDYCALRLELTEEAGEDRAGKGYWDILSYRDRWVPVPLEGFGFQLGSCFFGTDVESLVAAKAASATPGGGGGITPPGGDGGGSDGGTAPAEPSPREKQAKSCVQTMKFSFPVDSGGQAAMKEAMKKLFDELEALPAEQKKLSLLDVKPGQELFNKVLKKSMMKKSGPFGGISAPPGEAAPAAPAVPDLELALKDDKAQVLREMGTTGNEQCLFTPFNPLAYAPKAPDGGGVGGPFGPGVGIPPPPISVMPAVGTPPTPAVLVAPAAAAAAPAAAEEAPKADGAVYVKVRFPKDFQGVHGSPYWLSRHTSKESNRHLHRAREIFFSYFCTEINPDAANFQGERITDFPPKLKPYFAADDNHTKGSMNCYNCHTKVQPVANFFGKLSFGTQYDMGGGGFGGGDQVNWPRYLAENGGFDRPGGIYDGENFFAAEGSDRGLEGLANVLTKYPAAKQCIVDATWASLVGRESPLWDEERIKAIQAFENGGKPSLNRLVKHFTTESQRGVAYFTKGEVEFAKIQPQTGFSCPETVPEAMEKTALETMGKPGKKCKSCHEGEFFNEGKFDFENYFKEGVKEDTPDNRGYLWHQLYCKTKLQKMPPGGGGLDDTARGNIWCYFGRMRDKLAGEGKIPASYKDKVCQGAPAAQSAMGPAHTVQGTPPAGN